MAIRFPKSIRWNGREIPVEGAMERALKEAGNPPEEPELPQTPTGDMPNLNGFVSVKPLGIYVAKERSLQNHNWKDAHIELFKQGFEMPTPRETWNLLFYLKDNLSNPEYRKLYDDILKKTDSGWHGEWQNAVFSGDSNGMYTQRVTGINKGQLVLSKQEKLEAYLSQDAFADISNKSNLTSQGLCKTASSSQSYEQGKNIYFWYPRNGAVAWFGAVSDGAGLYCSWDPGDSDASLGVRAIRRAVAKNNGGKS